MERYVKLLGEVPIVINASITRRGHEIIIPNGHYVKCMHDHVAIRMYAKLDVGWASENEPHVCMNVVGVGIVLDHQWHVNVLNLDRSEIKFRSSLDLSRHVVGAYEDLYYLVAFKQGFFWARHDWIAEVEASKSQIDKL